jgi:hypothetical protein
MIDRLARVALAMATLALVFAPALLRGDHVPGPRDVAAAVLAPTTDDGAAVTTPRPRDLDPSDALVALLLVAIGLGAITASRRPAPELVMVGDRTRPPIPHDRRGPPSSLVASGAADRPRPATKEER